jgi:hypothetical protein
MDHPLDCPAWEYQDHPRKQQILAERVAAVLRDLALGVVDSRQVAMDTRPVHLYCFLELTPPGHEYYAGHYRGEPYRCLRHCSVGIAGDPRVGYPPQSVRYWMQELERITASGLHALDSDVLLSPKQRLWSLVVFICRVFEFFLRIHPYVNGNGHTARFILWSGLGRYGHWPRRWTVEPRPGPPYLDVIRMYRDGNHEALESYVLSMLSE